MRHLPCFVIIALQFALIRPIACQITAVVILANPISIPKEHLVKFFKKGQNCLFVEEERYEWASKKSSMNRHLITVSLLCLFAAFLFGALR